MAPLRAPTIPGERPAADAALHQVRRRRLVAFAIDLGLVLAPLALLAVVGLVAGVPLLVEPILAIPVLVPGCFVLMSVLEISGGRRATPGMRAAGLVATGPSGETVEPLVAAAHALAFFGSVMLLTPIILVHTFVDEDKALAHDWLFEVRVRRRPMPGFAAI
jgi:uncharacterized RDD family membrane protein YckC